MVDLEASFHTFECQTRPLFICGMPKSGTTLLLSLLDGHPDLLVIPEETKFLIRFLDLIDQSIPVDDLIKSLLKTTHVRFLVGRRQVEAGGRRDYTDFNGAHFKKIIRRCLPMLADTPHKLLDLLAFSYGGVNNNLKARIWVEKTPRNELNLKQAIRYWPNLIAVFIMRDPRDVYVSYRLKRERTGQLITFDEFVQMMMESLAHWRSFAAEYPSQCILVRYEDLVGTPETAIRRLSDFLGIPVQDSMLVPTLRGVLWTGNSAHGTAFSQISANSRRQFENHLDKREIEAFDTALGPVIEAFGYLEPDPKRVE